MSATARRLEIDEIAGHLDQIRATVIGRIQRGYPKVAREDLEDAYGDLCAEALSTSFGAVEQLEAWVQRALRRDAIDILRSARRRTRTALDPDDDTIFAVGEPDRALAGREARGLLHEFFASLPGQDRLIAYLYHDPGWGWKPERIAAATGIPVREVRRSVDRNGTRLRRFVLQDLAGERCASLAAEKLAWIETGELSLLFRWHLRRCPACRAELRDGRQAVRHALLPLLPAGSIPLAAGGLLARAHDAVLTHPLTIRAQDGIYRWRKLVPVGGGGTAAVAAKLVAAGAVVTAAAALHVIDHPDPRPREIRPAVHIHHVVVHRLPPVTATPTAVTPIVVTPVQHKTITNTTPDMTSTQATSTKASPTYNPPPLANPLPSGRQHSTRTERTALSSANTTTNGAQGGQTDAYAPAPVQSAPAAATHKTSQSSSSIPGPGGPPAP